ncbi:F-box/kelch-repeat protein [Pyrus ussuriensis x Pyrus communis]|uniref:F-box/kelch-repeat protein n=1 Tax=Pyrus ussuriensis x Pyrus communis TaxID=2448454 RepID=A0A5N5FFQ8_9ROSA|nr:F-box/kelch-repeat protein [Pyrus ussuriensis x Pyrus communis]
MAEMTQSTRSLSEMKKLTSSSLEMKPRPKLVLSKSTSGSLTTSRHTLYLSSPIPPISIEGFRLRAQATRPCSPDCLQNLLMKTIID